MSVDERLLEAPCVFCGYNGQGYWQAHTHNDDCPWRDVGGIGDRQIKLRDTVGALAIRSAANQPLKLFVATVTFDTVISANSSLHAEEQFRECAHVCASGMAKELGEATLTKVRLIKQLSQLPPKWHQGSIPWGDDSTTIAQLLELESDKEVG